MNDFDLEELRQINRALINYYNTSSSYLPSSELKEIDELQHKVKDIINGVDRNG